MAAEQPSLPGITAVGSSLPSDIRRNNRRALLRVLYPHQWLSRADLAKITGISKASVSDMVADLLEEDVLVEGGYKPSSKPGKPALLLGLKPQGKTIVALDLSEAGTVKAILSDLNGSIIKRDQEPTAVKGPLSLGPIVKLCRTMMALAPSPLLGVGVATPGTVDSHGCVIAAANLGWSNVNLATSLQDRLGLPVYVSNDANSAVFGEHCFAKGASNMIFIQIARGLGAGVLIDNRVVQGSTCVAGEIGHVVVDENGLACACGKRGCLETVTSVPFVRERLRPNPSQSEEILCQTGEVLGAALSMPVALTNITDIAISGPSDVVNKTLLESVANTINARVHSHSIAAVRVHSAQLGSDAAALGAVAIVLRHELGVL